MQRAVRTMLFGQAFFYAGLLLCVFIKPRGLGVNAGISYYGIFQETVLPYALGLLGAAYFTARAVRDLPRTEVLLRGALKVLALLIVGIVITPYAVASWVNDIHITCGAALFSLQLLMSCWLVQRLRYVWWGIVLTLAELASGIASAIYLAPAHGFLLQSQALFQLAFGALLILGLQSR